MDGLVSEIARIVRIEATGAQAATDPHEKALRNTFLHGMYAVIELLANTGTITTYDKDYILSTWEGGR